MKTIFYIIFRIILPWIAIIFHLYIAYIGFKHGVFSGLLTLCLPVISEIYWIIKLWSTNPEIKITALIILIGSFLTPFFTNEDR